MMIIGCDYHPGFQQIAFVDTDTGELQERRLQHREEAEKFYRDLAAQGIKVEVVSVQSNFLLSSAVSQFPTRTPSRLTPFTRRMPAARSGLRSPQSDASYASRRIAANLRLIVDGAYGRCSSAIRYRVTTVLLKAILGSEQYHSMNSRMAWSYERFELEDVRLFKTADFDCSRSGNLRTVFGTRLRLFFAIGSGLRCRGEKHDPVPDLLTSSAFHETYSQFGVEGKTG